MPLPVITIKNLEHHGDRHIGLYFEFDFALKEHTKKLDGVKWSASNKCWYIRRRSGLLDDLFRHYKDVAWLDIKQLTKDKENEYGKTNPAKKPALSKYKSRLTPGARIQVELMSVRLYAEGFSPNTIAVYKNMIEVFMGFVQKNAEELTIDDIREFQFNFWVKNNYSRSTQRQFIAALKHLIDTVPGLALEAQELVLPKKDKILPKVLSEEEVVMILENTHNLKHLTILSMLYFCRPVPPECERFAL